MKEKSKASQEQIFGIHMVEQMLRERPDLALVLSVDASRKDARIAPIVQLARKHGVAVESVRKETLEKKSHGGVHQGVMLSCRHLVLWQESDMEDILSRCVKPAFILILDGIQDPHNLGACMRSAHAMGVDMVLAPKNKACGLTPVVHKVSCGASILTPFIAVGNIARTMDILAKQGVWMVGMDASAKQSISQIDLSMPMALVMGAEGSGMRQLTLKHCDYLAKIPMQGQIESLNVSVAAGMAMYEVLRQRLMVTS